MRPVLFGARWRLVLWKLSELALYLGSYIISSQSLVSSYINLSYISQIMKDQNIPYLKSFATNIIQSSIADLHCISSKYRTIVTLGSNLTLTFCQLVQHVARVGVWLMLESKLPPIDLPAATPSVRQQVPVLLFAHALIRVSHRANSRQFSDKKPHKSN